MKNLFALIFRLHNYRFVRWARPSLVLQTAFRCAKKFLQVISVKISEFFSFSPRVYSSIIVCCCFESLHFDMVRVIEG